MMAKAKDEVFEEITNTKLYKFSIDV